MKFDMLNRRLGCRTGRMMNLQPQTVPMSTTGCTWSLINGQIQHWFINITGFGDENPGFETFEWTPVFQIENYISSWHLNCVVLLRNVLIDGSEPSIEMDLMSHVTWCCQEVMSLMPTDSHMPVNQLRLFWCSSFSMSQMEVRNGDFTLLSIHAVVTEHVATFCFRPGFWLLLIQNGLTPGSYIRPR